MVEVPAEAEGVRCHSLRRRFRPHRLFLRMDEAAPPLCQLGTQEPACAAWKARPPQLKPWCLGHLEPAHVDRLMSRQAVAPFAMSLRKARLDEAEVPSSPRGQRQ